MKDNYSIKIINAKETRQVLRHSHYLHMDTTFGFRSAFNFGLFSDDTLIGVSIFHCPSAPETMIGCFGLARNDQDGIYEIGRFSIIQGCYEKNLSSYFLAKTIKLLRQTTNVRAIITYADSDLHHGYLYQATNFKYYGLTDKKHDFYYFKNGVQVKHNRGKVKGFDGEWRVRTRKHRYLIIFDKTLQCKWAEKPYPKEPNKSGFNE